MVGSDKHRDKVHRVDFARYAVSRFTPHLFCDEIRPFMGCGATALSLLTGVPPEVFSAWNGRQSHFADRFMCSVLHAGRFKVHRLELNVATEANSKIGLRHVLLVSQLVLPQEGSWGVLHRQKFYHNFQIHPTNVLTFLNKPILSAYLVCHQNWLVPVLDKRKEQPTTLRECFCDDRQSINSKEKTV